MLGSSSTRRMGVLKVGAYHPLEAVNLVEAGADDCEPRSISEAIHPARLILGTQIVIARVMLHCHQRCMP